MSDNIFGRPDESATEPQDALSHLLRGAYFRFASFMYDDRFDALIASATNDELSYWREFVSSIEGYLPEAKAKLGMTA